MTREGNLIGYDLQCNVYDEGAGLNNGACDVTFSYIPRG